jgi:hypothetical protein
MSQVVCRSPSATRSATWTREKNVTFHVADFPESCNRPAAVVVMFATTTSGFHAFALASAFAYISPSVLRTPRRGDYPRIEFVVQAAAPPGSYEHDVDSRSIPGYALRRQAPAFPVVNQPIVDRMQPA